MIGRLMMTNSLGVFGESSGSQTSSLIWAFSQGTSMMSSAAMHWIHFKVVAWLMPSNLGWFGGTGVRGNISKAHAQFLLVIPHSLLPRQLEFIASQICIASTTDFMENTTWFRVILIALWKCQWNFHHLYGEVFLNTRLFYCIAGGLTIWLIYPHIYCTHMYICTYSCFCMHWYISIYMYINYIYKCCPLNANSEFSRMISAARHPYMNLYFPTGMLLVTSQKNVEP